MSDTRVSFAAAVNAAGYRLKSGEVLPDTEFADLFRRSLAFRPDRRPAEAVTDAAFNAETSRVAAGAGLCDFLLAWLEAPEPPAPHAWQERADCGL